MKKLFLLLFSLAFLSNAGYSQWVANYGSQNAYDDQGGNSQGNDCKPSGNGGSYVAGFVNHVSTGNDILLIKYNPPGDTAWTRSWNGTANGDDQGIANAVDAQGNIYVTGYATMTGRSTEMVVLKYNSNGTLLWANTWGGSNNNTEDRALGICVDASNNCYITGYSTDNSGKSALTTLKYNSSGSLQWNVREPGGNLDSKGLGITIDQSNNCYVTGYTKTNSGGNDIVVVKYNSSGSKQWLQTYNGTANGDDQALGITVDASNSVYITGYTTTNISTGASNPIIIKYNSSGTQQWMRTYNGTGNGQDRALGITVDPADGCIYTCGYTKNSSGNYDYLVVKYSSNGTQQWNNTYNGTGNGDDKASSIAVINNSYGHGIGVTGASWGTNNNNDYASVFYGTDGSQAYVYRYSMTATTNDQANKICSDNSNNAVFITGKSVQGGDASASSFVSTQMIPAAGMSNLKAQDITPSKFNLYQNYPNPFNPSTMIKFDLSKNASVKLVVYDMLGRVAATLINQDMTAGTYNISYNMANLSSGIYFYELNTGDYKDIKKMTLIK